MIVWYPNEIEKILENERPGFHNRSVFAINAHKILEIITAVYMNLFALIA